MEEVASSEQRPSNYGFVFPPPPRSKQRDSPGIGSVSKLWNVEQAQRVLYQKKRANVMIRFFWWSDPASLDTKEPKAMILFCQKKHIDSLNQSLACGNLKMWLKDTTNLG